MRMGVLHRTEVAAAAALVGGCASVLLFFHLSRQGPSRPRAELSSLRGRDHAEKRERGRSTSRPVPDTPRDPQAAGLEPFNAPSLAAGLSLSGPAPFDDLFDAELSRPLREESTGEFRNLYAAWRAEDDDLSATADACQMLANAFSALDIHPDGQNTRCGTALCRARFQFKELKALYSMTRVQEPDGVKLASTFPEGEEGAYTVSVYWTRNPNPTGVLMQTLGAAQAEPAGVE